MRDSGCRTGEVAAFPDLPAFVDAQAAVCRQGAPQPRYVITADDYGMCREVDDAIEECLAAGTLSAACVMANTPGLRGAACLPERYPHASIGIHWNLTTGYPVLPASQVPHLVDASGCFRSLEQLKWRFLSGGVPADEIKRELLAQYRAFQAVVGQPAFWNTHENINVWPVVFEIFLATALDLGIQGMRCHRRIVPQSVSASRARRPLFVLKGKIIQRWSVSAQRRGAYMPDGLLYAPGYDIREDLPGISCVLNWSAVRHAVELVVHPATAVRPEIFGNLQKSRVRDYHVFRDPGLKRRVAEHGIRIVNFGALQHAGV